MRAAAAGDPLDVTHRIREELALKGIKHKALAEHLGITQKHLSQIMMGNVRMTVPMLYRILAYLQLSLLLFPELPSD